MDLKQNNYMYELKEFGDERGNLVVLQGNKEIPFEIARLFYIYNTENNAIRGEHANLKSSFVMISMVGSCVVEIDDGFTKSEYLLDSPKQALFVNKMLWKTMKGFTRDNVLMVISDCVYDENEYVRDYSTYVKMMKEK